MTVLPAQSLAVDISLAALLGEGIYSFGELLLHPIVRPGCPRTPQTPYTAYHERRCNRWQFMEHGLRHLDEFSMLRVPLLSQPSGSVARASPLPAL